MTVTADLAITLDGYVAGPNVTLGNPGGDGAGPVFAWIHPGELAGAPGHDRRGRELVGGGIPFFPRDERRVDLELVETRTFSSRVVHLRYRVAGRAASWQRGLAGRRDPPERP